MTDDVKILEHEILRCLYSFCMFTTSNGSEAKGHIPLYEINYTHCTIHFGTLVDMLNTPSNYTNDKIPEGQLLYFQNLKKNIEEIDTSIYDYTQVAYAIETLKQNGQVKDTLKLVYSDIYSKEIILTEQGAIDFRLEFYLKKYQKETFESQLVLSTISTDASVRSTNEFQKKSLYATIGVAFLACVFQGLTWYAEKTKKEDNIKETLIDTVKESTRTLLKNQDETYLLLNKKIDSLANLLKNTYHDTTKYNRSTYSQQ